MDAQKLREELEAKREEIRSLAEKETLSEEEETRLSSLTDEFKPLEERTVAAETRAREIERVTARARHTDSGADSLQVITRNDPFADDPQRMTQGDKRDAAMRVLEGRAKRMSTRQANHVERLLEGEGRDAKIISERLLLTENPAYRSAFAKAMSQPQPILTSEEANAVNNFRQWEAQHEQRANEGTGSAGGYGVPVLIDPSIILTSGAADVPILDIARTITITTNQWKGVTSAGFNWAYQDESAVVTDNTPTLTQPTIPVYAARGFIPYTLELEQDYPGFEQEMSRLLAQGYVNLVASGTMTGSGSSQPRGIFTAMGATAASHVKVTTAGTISGTDVRNTWGALPERFRPNAHWVMNISVENQIRALGNNLALADYTVNLLADGTSVLTGRPVIVTDYAPNFTGQTTTFSYTVVGDFSHFLIIQRAGMTLELVPHLFDPTTGFPIGERGWFAFARHGYDIADGNAFRVMANTTSG